MNMDTSTLDLHPDEEWKWIKGFENRWAITNCGRVIRFYQHKTCRFRTLSIWSPSPYLFVVFGDPTPTAKRYKKYIHTMVCEAFHGPRPNPPGSMKYRTLPLYTVSHIDNDHLNNHADNLEWATFKDNHANSPNHVVNLKGKDHPAAGSKWQRSRNRAKLSMEQARMLREMRAKGISARDLARKYKICVTSVNMILRGVTYKDD